MWLPNVLGRQDKTRHSARRQTPIGSGEIGRHLHERQLLLEPLEDRRLLTAHLFVDFGDNFLGGILSTTQGAFRDVADAPDPGDKILGTTLVDSADGFNAGTQLDIVAQSFTTAERAQMMDVVRRAYLPLDIVVVELTASVQTTLDGRDVAGAASMADVVDTLRAGDSSAKDAYVFVATFIVDPGGANQQIYGPGGGGRSPSSPVLGVQSDLAAAANLHDDVAAVYSDGGFSNNTLNNIAHEAGHLFGLQHAITNATPTAEINLFHQAELMSYRNTNNTTSSLFTRYPMIRGDDNSPSTPPNPVDYNDLAARNGQVTIYDQMRWDTNILANPNYSFVSGTGAHDIITITRNGTNADVTVEAFADAGYTTPITVPSLGGTTYSYSFTLADAILVYAGDSNDQIIVDADLGVDVRIDGMLGTDTLIVDGKNAAHVVYTPNANSPVGVDLVPSFGGTITADNSSIFFENFETTGAVSIENVNTVSYVTPLAGADNLIVGLTTGDVPQVSGTVNDGTVVVSLLLPTVNRLAVYTGPANDTLTVDSTNGLVDFLYGISFNGGMGFDELRFMQTGGPTHTSTTYSVGPNPGQGTHEIVGAAATQTVFFENLEPVIDLAPSATLVVDATPAHNAINYRQGANSGTVLVGGAATGEVTIDNFESIEFANKTELIINALAGDDVVNLNNPSGPNTPAGLNLITVNGDEGNDRITTSEGVATNVEFFGGPGDDMLDASGVQPSFTAWLDGGFGNDLLIGGPGNDTLLGGAGDDRLVGSPGNNTYDGGAGFNTFLIYGTPANDRIDANQTAAGTLVLDLNGDVRNETVTDIQEVRIEAGAGDDIIRTIVTDILVATPADSLRFHVVGGEPNASDRLAVVDNAFGDLVIHRLGFDGRSGSITVGPLAPVVYEAIEFVQVAPLNSVTGGTGADGEGRLVVFKPDPFESNNSLPNATFLGSGSTINVDPLIDPGEDVLFGLPGDEDWFQVVAEQTGTLDFQVYFTAIDTLANGRDGLPGDGVLQIQVYDAAGNAVSAAFHATADEGARFRIPAVAGQSYYLRVLGEEQDAINVYSITIHNSIPPAPFDIELKDAPVDDTTNPPGGSANSDTGRSQFDNVTYVDTPTIFLRLDDAFFLNDVPGNAAPVTAPGWTIPVLHNADVSPADATTDPGFRVGIFAENDTHGEVLVGFAQPATDPLFVGTGVYEFTFADPLDDGSWFISARVQMTDPAVVAQSGWGPRSASLEIIVDSDPPPVSFGGLIPASDTGILPPNPGTIVDLITSDVAPTFWGSAEANAVVRIYADDGDGLFDLNTDIFLGQATAIPIDGTNQFPNGYWEIQSVVNLNDPGLFPLDGLRTIFATAEDVAGNVSVPDTDDEVLEIFIDTQGPVIEGVFANEILVGVNSNNELVQFNSQAPSTILATLPITGLAFGDVVAGIDVGPADGQLYAVVDGVATDRIYRVNPKTGAAVLVSTLTTPLAGTSFGVDFNPVTDQLRIVSDAGQNLRVNVLTGVVFVDAVLNPGAPEVVAAAYANNNAGATVTTLYTIDTDADVLNVQLGNAGTQVLVGLLGVDATAVAGFDIAQGSDNAFASLTVAGVTGLYRIDLATGDATPVDNIGDGSVLVGGLTALPQYDLFDPKPSTDGPTPLVYSLSIKFSDLPERLAPDFLYDALKQDIAEHPGHYLLVGDYNGPIAIREVIVRQFIQNVAGTQVVGPDNIAMATVELVFFVPLPDDRYTLTISDQLVDPVGNRLDGESNAIEPQNDPLFPTGDGLPGGDFVARFTVDSRPELGVWAAGSVYVDTNGNFFWDPNNLDATNRDIMYKLGYTTDHIFAGNFALPGETADGFDKLAAYGVEGNLYRWMIDTTNDGVANLQVNDPAGIIGIPVAGNFAPLISGDQVGLFTGTTWHLDTTGNYNVDFALASDLRGYPIVGDFDGDGNVDLATWQDDTFYFDLTGGVPQGWDGLVDATIGFDFIGARLRPVAADMDGDGITDIGLWVPDRAGMPDDVGEWYFLISNDFDGTLRSDGTVVTLDHAFSPIPLGHDVYARFGSEFAVPLVGNFDPPVGLVLEEPAEPRPSDLVGWVANGQWWVGESNGVDAFTNQKATKWSTSVTWVDVMTGDFNGDGLDDMLGRVESNGDWWVGLSNGDGTFTNQKWTRWSTAVNWTDVMVGDFNGDGKDDVIGRVGSNGDWWIGSSTGSGFTNAKWTRWNAAVNWVDVMVGDFNGDGRDDMIGRVGSNGDWWIGKSTGAGFTNERWTRWSPTVTWTDVMVGDFGGDGKDDIVGRVGANGDWWVATSTGTGFTNAKWTRWSAAVTWTDVMVGDFNGDGKDDVIGRVASNGDWWVASSTGTGFTNAKWTRWSATAGWDHVMVGNFTAAAMHAEAAPAAEQPAAQSITLADLRPVVEEAALRLSGDLEAMAFQVYITDLAGLKLAVTSGNTILIDDNAAGFGWYVHTTNAAFKATDIDGELQALADSEAAQRVDLLTVVMHEMGHLLGHNHDDEGLMRPTLRPGVRLLPSGDLAPATAEAYRTMAWLDDLATTRRTKSNSSVQVQAVDEALKVYWS